MTTQKPPRAATSLAWQDVQSCRTLMQVHDALVQLRPAREADPARWREYYLRSAVAYEQVAEIDRGHHHELLYWAGRERRKADAIAQGDTGPVGSSTETT
jgi:hypothetical protein